MGRVRLIHWKPEEAKPLIETLRGAGHKVEYDGKFTSAMFRGLRASPPDVVLIDLTRMPSHGRAVGYLLRKSPKTRHVPTVFVDGEKEKIDATKKVLPDAVYTTSAKVKSVLKSVIGTRVENPVIIEHPFSPVHRTTAQKMGIAKNARIGVIDGPRDYDRVLGEVPEGVEYVEGAKSDCTMLVWFAYDPDAFLEMLPRMRALVSRTPAKMRLWVLWKKGGTSRAGAMTQPLIREAAISLGMVDYKICSVDKTWSGMALTMKKATNKHE